MKKLISNETIKNIVWMVLDKVVISLLNFFISIIVINHYAIDEYGTYQYVFSVVTTLEIFTAFIDGRVVKKLYTEYDNHLIVYNAIICRLFCSLLIFVISLLCIFVLNKGLLFNTLFIVFLLNLIILQVKNGLINKFEFELKSKIISIINAITLIIGDALQLFVILNNLDIIFIAIILLLVTFVQALIIYNVYSILFKSNTKLHFDYILIKRIVRESLPLAIAAICAILYAHCDILMIGNMLTMREVAIYSFAVKLLGFLQFPLNAIKESIYPTLVKEYNSSKDKFYSFYQYITTLTTWFIIIVLIGSYVFLPFIFRLIKAEYMNSYNIYLVLSISAIFLYNAAFRSSYLTIINKGKVLMISQLISVFVNIVLNIYLIMKLNMIGAALATVITQGLSLLLLNIFFGEEGYRLFIIQLKSFDPTLLFLKESNQ